MNSREFMFEDQIIRNALYKIRETEMGNTELSALPENTVVAMAYVPFQNNTTMYGVSDGFSKGTIFPELDKPFLGGKCR